jgi:G3E family GTPase
MSSSEPASAPMRLQLPVHVLTGFLGSGKTTLLSHLLRQPALADTAVIINELGDVGLDHVLVDRGSEDDVVLLDSGCLCCALGNSLQETLESLYYRRARGELPPFTRVVIETTGVADPGPIAATLQLDSAIARHYRLGSIVTVIDTVHGAAQLARFAEARRQVAMADRLVLTKGDLVDAATTAGVTAQLAALNPHAPFMAAVAGDIDGNDVLVDMLDARALPRTVMEATGTTHDAIHDADDDEHEDEHHHATHAHDHLQAQGITSTTLRLSTPLDWPRYAAWVQWMQQTLGERLLRMKGAVRMVDGEARALHAVMRLFSAPLPLRSLPADWGDGVVVLITQDVGATLLDEARRRLVRNDV